MTGNPEVKRLDPDDYLQLQQHLLMFGPIVAEWELEAFIAQIDRADTLCPVPDPTLWIRGHKNLSKIRELAVGALAFKRAVVKARDEAGL